MCQLFPAFILSLNAYHLLGHQILVRSSIANKQTSHQDTPRITKVFLINMIEDVFNRNGSDELSKTYTKSTLYPW
jgi:hypothetical protein